MDHDTRPNRPTTPIAAHGGSMREVDDNIIQKEMIMRMDDIQAIHIRDTLNSTVRTIRLGLLCE